MRQDHKPFLITEGESSPEPSYGDAGGVGAQPFSVLSAADGLAPGGPCVGETWVLDHNRAALLASGVGVGVGKCAVIGGLWSDGEAQFGVYGEGGGGLGLCIVWNHGHWYAACFVSSEDGGTRRPERR